MDLNAWHLPGVGDDDVVRMDEQHYGALRLRRPVLRAGAVTRLAGRLNSARRDGLVNRSAVDIVRIIDEAVARMTSGRTRADILAALPEVSGFSSAMAERILDGMARDWRAPALHALLVSELGDAARLDRFIGPDELRVRAFGPPLITHIFAGNVPGVGVTALIRALLVKSASIGKTAAREPVLAALFAQTLAQVDEQIGACVAVSYWPGGALAEHAEQEAFAAADTIVVYGGDEAVAAVRAAAPATTRILEHGPKLSFGVVGRAALRDREAASAVADSVARATAEFDQHGCVSPHFVFVEDGAAVSAEELAPLIAQSLSKLDATLPRGELSAADAARIREVATRAEFRAIGGARSVVHHAANAVVIFDDLPTLEASCLNRTLFVKPVARIDDVVERVVPYRDVLQSVAFAGIAPDEAERLAADLAAAGVTRITDFERLAWPPAPWHHDGRGPLLELLRFVDYEGPTPRQ